MCDREPPSYACAVRRTHLENMMIPPVPIMVGGQKGGRGLQWGERVGGIAYKAVNNNKNLHGFLIFWCLICKLHIIPYHAVLYTQSVRGGAVQGVQSREWTAP